MNKHTFINPQNLCLEELRLKYISDVNSYEENIPALDQRWCNKDYLYTLYISPPSKNSDGTFTMGSKEDWLERIELFIDDMYRLLEMEYHRFWSEVAFNKQFLDGVNSYLQNAPPYYSRESIPDDKIIIKQLSKCHKLVFTVLIRLTRTKESEQSWMKITTLGNIIYDNFIFSIPQLMDICLIYGYKNVNQVKDLINCIIDIQPKYISDIEKITPFISKVFSNLEKQLNPFNELNDYLPVIQNQRVPKSTVNILKLILLVLDIGYSLATFVDMCPQAASVCHEQHLEDRIASFYENIIPELTRLLEPLNNDEETRDDYQKYLLKLNHSRHQLILTVNRCLTPYLSSILEQREFITYEEMKSKVDNYLNTIFDCLNYHIFMRDYNSGFPIQKDVQLLSEICPDIDSVKCGYIIESVLSLYDLPPKTQHSKDVVPSVEEASTSRNCIIDQTNHRKPMATMKKSGVELESLISEVKDILPHLGDGFVESCLEFYNYVSADVINAILEGSLPDSLASLDIEAPIIPPEETENATCLPERINLYDNDEFDIMTQSRIDTSRVHRGKRPDKHKNLSDMLDDKSHVNQLRDVYSKLSLVETVENLNEYDDEYDDTYDDVDVRLGNEGETEAEERRAFVVPRVLQQGRKSLEEPQELEEDEIENERDNNADLFVENPADIRERAEQRRRDMRGRGSGRARAAFPQRDVVGKPRGQGQDKEVLHNRESKNTNKASRANHNRRYMADRKRHQGMIPS